MCIRFKSLTRVLHLNVNNTWAKFSFELSCLMRMCGSMYMHKYVCSDSKHIYLTYFLCSWISASIHFYFCVNKTKKVSNASFLLPSCIGSLALIHECKKYARPTVLIFIRTKRSLCLSKMQNYFFQVKNV